MNSIISYLLFTSIVVDIVCEFLLVRKIKKEKDELQNRIIELEKRIKNKRGE